jgi:hypothetical protein
MLLLASFCLRTKKMKMMVECRRQAKLVWGLRGRSALIFIIKKDALAACHHLYIVPIDNYFLDEKHLTFSKPFENDTDEFSF